MLQDFCWYVTDTVNEREEQAGFSVPRDILKRIENACPHKNCAQILMVTLFKIARRQEQPKCPSTDG